jgi:GrpB-like predicted nucleotidyltransferase (UPF0157 family)
MMTGNTRHPVRLVPFDRQWAKMFRDRAAALQGALSPHVDSIDHIGSTAIPGMLAKPVIDIDVTVRSLDDIAPATHILVGLGYEPRGNHHDDDMWAFLFRDNVSSCRTYLCPPENLTHRRRMAFRDYLIARPDAAKDYATLKTRLAAKFESDGDAYTAAKRDFIESILLRAKRKLNTEDEQSDP